MNETPQIYVACLASYNAGHLFGEWLDVDSDAEDLGEAITELISRSPARDAEEYAIHDHENFQGFNVGEFSSLSEVCKAAELIEQHGPAFGAACAVFVNDEIEQALTERYRGAWESAAEYAEDWTDQCGDLANVPDSVRGYIDWESYARDMCITEVRLNGEVHVFDNY